MKTIIINVELDEQSAKSLMKRLNMVSSAMNDAVEKHAEIFERAKEIVVDYEEKGPAKSIGEMLENMIGDIEYRHAKDFVEHFEECNKTLIQERDDLVKTIRTIRNQIKSQL